MRNFKKKSTNKIKKLNILEKISYISEEGGLEAADDFNDGLKLSAVELAACLYAQIKSCDEDRSFPACERGYEDCESLEKHVVIYCI